MSEKLSSKDPELITVTKETPIQEIEDLVILRTNQLQEAKIALGFLKAQQTQEATLPFDAQGTRSEFPLDLNSVNYIARNEKIQSLLIENDYLRDKIAQLQSNQGRREGSRGLKALTDQEDAEIMLLDFENASLKNEIARLNEALYANRPETLLRKFGKFLLTR